ncbi:MAG: hypothetical protein WDO19_19585 [Bacteroidota bacterium]
MPEELIHQPKRGFEIPLKQWIDGQLKDMIAAYLLHPDAYCRSFLPKGAFLFNKDFRILSRNATPSKTEIAAVPSITFFPEGGDAIAGIIIK